MKRQMCINVAAATVTIASTIASATPEAREPGLTVWAWQHDGRLPDFPLVTEGQVPNAYFIASAPSLDDQLASGSGEAPLRDHFSGVVRGWIQISDSGVYRFRLRGDDGARLILDDRVILDTERAAGFTIEGGVFLDAGEHAIEIPFYEDEGRFYVELTWQPPGSDGTTWQPIPESAFTTEAGQTFVTAPGPKTFSIGADARRPGDGKPLDAVHPSMHLEAVRPQGYEPAVGAMTFLPDGRLAVARWDESGAIDLIDGLDNDEADGTSVTVSRFADGLGEPLGLCVLNGVLYVAHKNEVMKLIDTDGDDVCDRYEVVAGGWPSSHNYHEFTFDLVALNGRLYTATSVPLRSGHTQYTRGSEPAFAVADGPGTLIEINPTNGTWEIAATGLRTPNGVGIGPDSTLYIADNQGSWLPVSRLNRVTRGAFFGHQTEPDGTVESDAPVLWLPHGEIGNSPTTPVTVPDGVFAGQMLFGDVTHGGIKRMAADDVRDADGNIVYQGAVFRFCQGLEAGVNRLLFAKDGSLYVGGIGSNGNWHHRERRFGLQRLRPTDEPFFDIHHIASRADGFVVTFTQPVAASHRADPSHWQLTQYRYEERIDYGGPKRDVAQLPVTGVTSSEDGRQLFLRTEGLVEGSVVAFRAPNLIDEDRRLLVSPEAWYTLNAVSRETGPAGSPFETRKHRVPTPPPADAIHLVGRDAHRMQMHVDGADVRWPMQNDVLEVDKNAGDIVSRELFEDCFLHVEWFSPPGGPLESQRNGNSGVKLQNRYEIQIMNTPGGMHPSRFNEAGAIYRQKAADHNASTGAGTWQTYEIDFRAARWGGENGQTKIESARITVWWNGVLVHDDVAIETKTGMSVAEAPGPGPILLQAHASDANGPVRYRNVWVQRKDAATSESSLKTGGDTP